MTDFKDLPEEERELIYDSIVESYMVAIRFQKKLKQLREKKNE